MNLLPVILKCSDKGIYALHKMPVNLTYLITLKEFSVLTCFTCFSHFPLPFLSLLTLHLMSFLVSKFFPL